MANKRLLKYLLLSSLLFGICGFILLNKVIRTRVKADAVPDYIGEMYSIELVNQETKVYVPNNGLLQTIISSGRTVHYEDIIPGGEMNGGGNQSNNIVNPGDIINIITRRYYYFATPTKPKILSSCLMYNDYNSLKFALQYLEYLSFELGSDNANDVVGYIRGINSGYTSDRYTHICGPINQSFIAAVNLIDIEGLQINEYFASFLESSASYNNSLYKECSATYTTKHYRFIDPISENKTIDLIHLFTSLDGIAYNTGSDLSTGPYSYLSDTNIFKFLVSWAGDLQTACVYVEEQEMSNYIFEDILEDSDSTFDVYDYKADIDAFNIGIEMDFSCDSVYLSFIDYYDNTISYFNYDTREQCFMDELSSLVQYNGITDPDIKFQKIIYEMLGVDEYGNSIFQTNILNPDYYMCCIKYHYLRFGQNLYELNPFSEPAVNVYYRFQMANAFIDYFY